MSLNDLIKDSDGFRIGVCITTISIISYLMYSDMKEKDYRVLPFNEGIRNTKEMFIKDTTYINFPIGRIEKEQFNIYNKK